MSTEVITGNDLKAILNEVLPPTASEYKKLLWENPSPTSTFAAQTINLNLSEYDEISIEWMHNVNNADAMSQRYFDKCVVEEKGSLFLTRTDSWLTQMRDFSTTTSGVTFNECKLGSNATVYNNHCVPLKIYGIKYERVAPPQVELPTYSTEEQVIGTWVDGKPIYRKVLTGTGITGGANYTVSNVATNVDIIIDAKGLARWTNGTASEFRTLNFAYDNGSSSSAWYGGVTIDKNANNTISLRFQVGSNFGSNTLNYWHYIIEYTKTTD